MPVVRVVPWRVMASGAGQGEFRLLVITSPSAPEAICERVWSRSALASGSSSSVAAEAVFFSNRICALIFQKSSSVASAWFRRGWSERFQMRDWGKFSLC